MSLPPSELAQLFSKLGQFLLVDDAHDIGRFDRLHHWQYGFVMSLVGELMRMSDVVTSFTANLLKPPILPPMQPPASDGTEAGHNGGQTKEKDYLDGRLP